MSDVFLCGPDDVQGGLYPPCPHPDVDDDGFCLTCDHPGSEQP